MKNFVKNSEMNAQIDPKVVMDLSIIQNWWMEQFATQQPKTLSEEFFDENEPWLLIAIPSREPFLVTEYLKRHSVSVQIST